ncbi:MAG: hypothetical protein ABI334_07590 [Candidatus Dormiibacterota bacterium]
MAVANPPKSKAASGNRSATAEAFAPSGHDLLVGLRWGTRDVLVATAVLIAIDIFAGWTYVASYFGFFRVPIEGLGLSLPEVLAQGLRTVLLPITVVVVAAVAPNRRLRPAAIGVGGYLLFLAVVAVGNHWASPGSVAVQLAASIVIAGAVFGLRLGFGETQIQRLVIGALALLLLLSIPVATGILDATQKAATKTSTLQIVTSTAILPSATPASGQFSYTNYVLLRESDTRYWLFRIGGQYAYSIAKSEVLYIRY